MNSDKEKQAFQIGDEVQCYITGKVKGIEIDAFEKKIVYSVTFKDEKGKDRGRGTFQAEALENMAVVK